MSPSAEPSLANQPSGGGSGVAGPSQNAACASMDIDEVLTHAANQFKAGFARTALELTNKALSCKRSEPIYQLAMMYACVAHDAVSAKKFYSKLSKPFQAHALQRCQEEVIDLP
jgi:hypothetical protein